MGENGRAEYQDQCSIEDIGFPRSVLPDPDPAMPEPWDTILKVLAHIGLA
jgi:hypothetical protein